MNKFLLLLLLSTLSVFSQDKWPEPFIINDNFPLYNTIPEDNWQYTNTDEKAVPFRDITKPVYATQFKRKESLISNINKKSHVWLRYRIKNTTAIPQIITFAVDRDHEHFYVQNLKGNWEHFTNGDHTPWSKRNGIKYLTEVKYTLAAGQEIYVYNNIGDITFFGKVAPKIGNYLKVANEHFDNGHIYSTDDVISFAFFGFIIFSVIFNLLFYYVNRERVYLVYSCLLVFSALLVGEKAISMLVFSEYRSAYPFFLAFVITMFIIMLIHTIRYFFRINIHFKGWDKFLIYFTVYIGITGFLVYLALINKWAIFLICVVSLTALAVLVFIVAAIILIVSLLKQKDKEARLFVIAAMPFLVSPVISGIVDADWIITGFGMYTILVLSWGMFARFKSLQIANARAALEKEEERNRLIAQQKEELEALVKERTAELSQTITSLKQTQNQLVQSEKMASLGELTAGIAHEIQNPLNFVNNFSDVSIELLDEMQEELDKGDAEEAIAIAGDIKLNLEKIAHHGRRADGIVKGMLQHSRASSGYKEPADVNSLADEYLRLAYHGLRAKDKSFNAELITDFDTSLPKINMIPQDVGRVLLNLFTNAFYATQQKQKTTGSDYKPKVELVTKKIQNGVEITVRDNGTGIPDAIKDKILQPFFTTKPTGEGTGLGLSLSYDIIVKGHAGTIDIQSTQGEGAVFIITLPQTL